jgi:hypothetical protein
MSKNNTYEQGIVLKGILDEEFTGFTIEKFPVIKKVLKKIANAEGEVELTIKPLRYSRSDAQNRYYWGVCVVTIAHFLKESQGRTYSRDQIHALNLSEVAGNHMVVEDILSPKTGKITTIATFSGKSTSQMNTKEFAEFIDNLLLYWADLGCDIPEPKEKPSPNFITEFLDDE